MIVCPNCTHQNPNEAVHCEACYTPLPNMTHCPNCHATVQADASFCGQCGFNLQSAAHGEHHHHHHPHQQAPLPPTVAMDVNAPLNQPSPGVAPLPPTVAIPSGSSHPTIATHETVQLSPPDESPDLNMGMGMSSSDVNIPDLPPPDPIVQPEPFSAEMQRDPMSAPPTSVPPKSASPMYEEPAEFMSESMHNPMHHHSMEADVMESEFSEPMSFSPMGMNTNPSQQPIPPSSPPTPSAPTPPPMPISPPTVAQVPARAAASHTILQTQTARLLHVQTNTPIEMPANLNVIHIGKPNDRVPPDVDVSGFPNSEIVSRVHADIRVEGDLYYIEDVGSANGTYINNMPLPIGNRHRLRPGDRIALGKGDKVTFLFQIS